jgi:MYND finger
MVGALPNTLMLTLAPKIDQALRLPQSENKVAFQIVPVQLRAWVVDQNDVVCRPHYMACLELYPRGKVINQRIHIPASRVPDPEALLHFLLDHMLEPPTGEPRQRPTHVSFVDESVASICAPVLAKLRIEGGFLTLADGVEDYVKKFSDKLVSTDRASRGDAAERPGLLSVPGVTNQAALKLMTDAVAMYRVAPWKRVAEHIALQVTLPPPLGSKMRRLKYFATVLGSDEKALGFALVPSLTTLRTKYRRAMSGALAGIDDIDDADPDAGAAGGSLAVGELLCAGCGQRVGEEERDGARYVDRCGGCKRLLYCDDECQRRDWALRHREECRLAGADADFIFRRDEWAWMRRELALLFVNPTSIPFDDLDAGAANDWPFIGDATPPLYPMAFVTVDSPTAAGRRVDRPSAEELRIMSLVAMALTECSAPPPADGAVHLANGVALRVAENLTTSTRGANPTPDSPNLNRGAGASGENASC